jgi:multiple sugar transport system substrate-binding protein
MGEPALTAMRTVKQLASSPAADPSLSVQQEDQNRLAMEGGSAAFEIDYPFVYPSMKSDKPNLFRDFKRTTYPTVTPGSTAHPTISGLDLTISRYSRYKALAMEAALCLRNPADQLEAAALPLGYAIYPSLQRYDLRFPNLAKFVGLSN